MPPDDFAAKARDVMDTWGIEPAAKLSPNAEILRALTKAAPASLKDVAAVYNRVVKSVEERWTAARATATKAGKPVPASLPDAEAEALRSWALAEYTPSFIKPDAAAETIKRQINDKTAALKREIEALNWTEPGAPLRAMAMEMPCGTRGHSSPGPNQRASAISVSSTRISPLS